MQNNIIDCECGAKVSYSIMEGNSPGSAEREEVHCPQCGKLLHSGVYNDARVSVTLIKDEKKP